MIYTNLTPGHIVGDRETGRPGVTGQRTGDVPSVSSFIPEFW